MLRYTTLAEISDGRLYQADDRVKADCKGCKNCSKCCHGMGDTIVLDPYDVHRIVTHMPISLEELFDRHFELGMVDGVILPHLKMGAATNACTFLNDKGRCSIHSIRPGICRLFPLGRCYDGEGFSYFLQTGECMQKSRDYVKVKDWIDEDPLPDYEAFVCQFHYFIKDFAKAYEADPEQKQASVFLLKTLYLTPYDAQKDFYSQAEKRMRIIRETMLS